MCNVYPQMLCAKQKLKECYKDNALRNVRTYVLDTLVQFSQFTMIMLFIFPSFHF